MFRFMVVVELLFLVYFLFPHPAINPREIIMFIFRSSGENEQKKVVLFSQLYRDFSDIDAVFA